MGDRFDADEHVYLSSCFFVAVHGGGMIVCPQLLGEGRRASRGIPNLLAALSQPEPGPIGPIIEATAAESGVDADDLIRRVAILRLAGLAGTEPAAPLRGGWPLQPPPRPTAPIERGTHLKLVNPVGLLVDGGGFGWFDHQGILRARFSVAELMAVKQFGAVRTLDEAWAPHEQSHPRLERDAFDRLASELLGLGIAQVVPDEIATQVEEKEANWFTMPTSVVQDQVDAVIEEFRAERRDGSGIPVVPVNVDQNVAPLSLGVLVSHAMSYDGGRLQTRFDFAPQFLTDEEHVLEWADEPAIFLFSNYIWNVERNLSLSALVKRMNPASLTIHGGPSTPKYEADSDEFFAVNPHVDISVHGEGEVTFVELLDVIESLPLDLDALRDVAGLSFRSKAGPVVHTADRERIADLDTIPSPYLMGLLDPFGSARAAAIIETNRGCPYGCTFCDWGSATLSRIRKFSLERVFGELEWSAKHQIEIASIADANFGIMERDVEIAQKLADLKRTYGFPRTVASNYAKNTVKYLRQIIEIFADVEILTEGVVSLQTMDEPTLRIIRRSNIKLEKYNELSTEFRQNRLPLAADIMMGLPGSTAAGLRNDLQQCTNRDVRVRANPTQLLPNSPMNEPEYRATYGIVAKPGEFVMESTTFTREDWDDMNRLRLAYYIFDNWGVLRYVSRFVRRETGIHEVDFYDRIRTDARRDPDRWPMIVLVLGALEGFMAPPASWGLFLADIRRYLIEVLGVADDAALATTFDVQLAHLPAPERTFPDTLSLEHDFVAWQLAMLAAREEGHRDDWEQVIPRLETYGPAELTISDPNDICGNDLGKLMGFLGFGYRSWDFDSPVARPHLGIKTAV